MISTLQVPAAAPSGSSSTVAVTFTSSSIRLSEALYGARGSIEVTNVMISAMRRKLSKLVGCYRAATDGERSTALTQVDPEGQERSGDGGGKLMVVYSLEYFDPNAARCFFISPSFALYSSSLISPAWFWSRIFIVMPHRADIW